MLLKLSGTMTAIERLDIVHAVRACSCIQCCDTKISYDLNVLKCS